MNSQNKCCFKNKSEKYIAKTGIIFSIISILLLLWGIIELNYDTNIIKYFYYISFGLITICLIGFISIVILRSEKINKNKNNVNKTLNFISVVIFGISLYSLILLIIHFVVEIYDYVNAESILPFSEHIPIKKWAALFIPSLISFICLIFIIIASKDLFKPKNSEQKMEIKVTNLKPKNSGQKIEADDTDFKPNNSENKIEQKNSNSMIDDSGRNMEIDNSNLIPNNSEQTEDSNISFNKSSDQISLRAVKGSVNKFDDKSIEYEINKINYY